MVIHCLNGGLEKQSGFMCIINIGVIALIFPQFSSFSLLVIQYTSVLFSQLVIQTLEYLHLPTSYPFL